MPFKFIEHTADIAVEVTGSTLEELFSSACRAWSEAAFRNTKPELIDSKKFLFTALTTEELLVELLSELNYQLYTKKWVFVAIKEIKIEFVQSKYHLIAEVFGQPFKAEIHTLNEEIKAITFHQLKIEESPGGFFTKIVFDI